MSFQPPKGTDDVLAPESESWRGALRLWESWSERYGYPLALIPVLEATDLFERGVGETTEVVTKQMYTFTDQGGRSVSLRPEGTAGVVRAFLNTGHRGPWKAAYSGPFFRYERPQAGRRRQFFQLGVEYIDVESPEADAEVIELGYRYLQDLGVPALQLIINSLGDQVCRPVFVDALRSYLRSKESELSENSLDLIDKNPLRVLDSKEDGPKLNDHPRMIDHLCGPCSEHYDSVKRLLSELDIPHLEDDGLVRGLDYYTRTTFEYIGGALDAAQNAVGGGGRYDGLAESIGGRRAPGVGFALGLDRIILSIGERGEPYLDAYLISETGAAEALVVASRLRRDGLRVDFDTEGRSVKAQFRTASRVGAPVILVWRGADQPIDIQTRDERAERPLEEVASWFRTAR